LFLTGITTLHIPLLYNF